MIPWECEELRNWGTWSLVTLLLKALEGGAVSKVTLGSKRLVSIEAWTMSHSALLWRYSDIYIPYPNFIRLFLNFHHSWSSNYSLIFQFIGVGGSGKDNARPVDFEELVYTSRSVAWPETSFTLSCSDSREWSVWYLTSWLRFCYTIPGIPFIFYFPKFICFNFTEQSLCEIKWI